MHRQPSPCCPASEKLSQTPHALSLLGDWNLTEHREDSNGKGDHFASTPKLREASPKPWTTSASRKSQPHHTRVSCHQGSSRLDRFYISHLLAEKCLMVPEVTLPTHPHMPGKDAEQGPSDHFPIRLSFTNSTLTPFSRFKIPEWLARHKTFLDTAKQRLKAEMPLLRRGKPKLIHAKKIVRSTAVEFMKTHREAAKTSDPGTDCPPSTLWCPL